MKRLTLLTLPILALASLTSCGGDDPLTYKKGDRIYEEKIFTVGSRTDSVGALPCL